MVAAAGHRRAKDLAERDREHAGRRVRPIIDILPQRETLVFSTATTNQRDRVDFQHQRRGALMLRRRRVEDMRVPGGDVEGLHPVGMLVQQEPEIGGRLVSGGDGQ